MASTHQVAGSTPAGGTGQGGADAPENEAERRRWNDPDWVAGWPVREQLTACATDALLAAARLAPGQCVLDVGPGCGDTLRRTADAVGGSGRVIGVDLSAALVERARRLVADLDNVEVRLADAATDDLGGPHDRVLSRFGVMFFEHPTAAFEHLRRHVAPRGRLAFACWQAASENPWHLSHAIGRFVASPAAPAPGAHATGPFAFSDPADVASILEDAGFEEVEVAAHAANHTVDREAIVGQLRLETQVAREDLAEATAALAAHEASFARSDGRLEVPVAYFVVAATAP